MVKWGGMLMVVNPVQDVANVTITNTLATIMCCCATHMGPRARPGCRPPPYVCKDLLGWWCVCRNKSWWPR